LEQGIDPAWSLDLNVPLDTTSRVVVRGFACGGDDNGDDENAAKVASGFELAELFEAYNADYNQYVVPRLADYPNGWEATQAIAADAAAGAAGVRAAGARRRPGGPGGA
ncbi:MAG TPA: hypothetical protein PLV68_12075, partial [Ilumatobacteraceae bacterium]|nr:hypothetical protein [Ilumatobacteraceae bacterium]